MMLWESMGALALLVTMVIFACWAFHRVGRETGYETGRADALQEVLDHARDQQRTAPRPKLAPPGPPRLHDTAPQARAPKHATRPRIAFAPPSPADDEAAAVTDTGEMAALTNEYIHNMRWSEEQFRRSLASGVTA